MTTLDLRPTLLCVVLALFVSCATEPPESAPSSGTAVAGVPGDPTEGLERIPLDGQESLYLRRGWRIGGYDALMFAPVELTFDAGTRVRAADRERLEKLVVDMARDSLVAAGLPVHEQPGPCTLLSKMSVLDVELHTPSGRTGSAVNYVASWGRARIEYEHFDSQTGTRLVYFVTRRKIPGGTHGSGRDWSQIERTMRALIADAQRAMHTAMQRTRMTPARPGCRGDIYRAYESGVQLQ